MKLTITIKDDNGNVVDEQTYEIPSAPPLPVMPYWPVPVGPYYPQPYWPYPDTQPTWTPQPWVPPTIVWCSNRLECKTAGEKP